MAQLRTWPRFPQIGALLRDPERLVRDVVDSLARNTRGATGRPDTVFTLQVRGACARSRCGACARPLPDDSHSRVATPLWRR